MSRPATKQQGFVLVLVIVLSATFLAIGLTIADLVAARYQTSRRTVYVEDAVLAAEAGITDTLNQVLSQPNFTGYDDKKELYSDTDRGKAEYTSSVTYDTITALYKVTATGYVYKNPLDTTPVNTKSVEVTASLSTSPVAARVAAGPGGLIVNGGTVSGKNIWVNGKVVLNSGYIGAPWHPLFGMADVTLNVANLACGSGANYPQRCTGPFPGAGEPIHVAGGSGIYGTVCASDQTTYSNIFPGQAGMGLLFNCSSPPVVMPKYDRQTLFDSMTTTKPGFYCGAGAWWLPQPPHQLEGNTIYNGDVTLAPPLFIDCNSTISGDVYIRGNLTVTGGFAPNIYVAENDVNGNPITTPPVIAVEGSIHMAQGLANIYPNSRGVGPIFVSFNSTNATCNSDPACNSLSPTDLYNSVNVSTVTVAGDLSAPSSVFYSYFGTVNIANGTVGAVAGQRIYLSSNGGFSGLFAGGIHKDSFPVGDAFGGKVRISGWNVINYKQVFP